MIRDYLCKHDQTAALVAVQRKNAELTFPDAYLHADTMARLSQAIKAECGSYCVLPFCHTVEAEALGAHINYGDERQGPRAGSYCCKSAEELLALQEADFSQGRIHEVLLACRMLAQQGEKVVLEVTGPLTVLNSLIDPQYVFRAMRKEPELMQTVFAKLTDLTLAFMLTAEQYGVRYFSYADPTGGVNIVGPKVAKQMAQTVTLPFLKKVQKQTAKDTLVFLCPKTAYALIDTDCADWAELPLSKENYYAKACMEIAGRAKFMGQSCIKNTSFMLHDTVKALTLRETI